jgi:hypothetical protein
MQALLQCYQNAPAYFATAVSYTCKMFMKLTPWACTLKLFTVLNIITVFIFAILAGKAGSLSLKQSSSRSLTCMKNALDYYTLVSCVGKKFYGTQPPLM